MYTTAQMNLMIEVCGILISSAILLFLQTSGDKDSKLNRLFTRLIVCNIFAMSLAVINRLLADIMPEFVARSINFTIYGTVNLLLPLLADYVYALIERNLKLSRTIPRIVYTAYFAWLVTLVVSEFRGIYFYYSHDDNLYYFGEYFWVIFLFAVFSLILITGMIIRYRKSLGRNDTLYLLFFPALSILSIVAPIIMEDIVIIGDIVEAIYVTNAFFALFCYGGIQARQAKLLRDKEVELADSRTAIMLSQIQPHFLYNTLASIEYLCECGEAREAGTAIRDFSKYLRGNMDSLTYKEPIPFEKELEHVMLYLLLEKKRFEERLAVTIEIGVTDFTIPALTLQPIVENAVKHGVTKRDEGGKITIKTDEDDNSWIVTVTDDGVGYDIDGQPENEINQINNIKGTAWGVAGDGQIYEVHSDVGIANVRSRLEAMCSGTLEIYSTPGKGTTAIIKIPKDQRRN